MIVLFMFPFNNVHSLRYMQNTQTHLTTAGKDFTEDGVGAPTSTLIFSSTINVVYITNAISYLSTCINPIFVHDNKRVLIFVIRHIM